MIGAKVRNFVNSCSIYGSKFFPNYDSNHSKYQPKAETKKDPIDPEIEAQRVGQNILGKSWSDIREQTKLYPKALREAGLAARTKTQKKWVEQLPQAIADFILSSDDDSDLTWLPNSVKTRVQVLLQEARKAAA